MAGRILIADPTATNRIILKVCLTAARYQIVQAQNGQQAMDVARRERPDLVIVNAHLADMSGAEFCAALRADSRTEALPVLVVTGTGNRDDRLAALRAGADDYLAKPFDDVTLLARARNLIRARATFDELLRRVNTFEAIGFAEATRGYERAPRVAVIAAAPETGLAWQRALTATLSAHVMPLTRTQALDGGAGHELPDAYVIAADLSRHGDGLRLVSELRSHCETRQAAIIVHDHANDVSTLPLAFDLGANAVMSGSFDAEELAARLITLIARKRATDALRDSVSQRLDQATRDPLTGLFNRRYAEAYLARVAQESAHSNQPFALMLLDLDRFKSVNDTFGHRIGDAVLVETARRLGANMREVDLLARYGGEEFLVAMPETGFEAAARTAERLRRVIGDHPIQALDVGVPLTVSIGVTLCSGPDLMRALPALIDEADTALYASKHEGRNLVTFAAGAAA
jgi:two-component system cell cycle response regulator